MARSALIAAPYGPVLSPRERAFFADAQPWGFILFARNIETKPQLRALCADLRDAVGWHAPILIDQEGGRVQRMRGPDWREFPPALDQAEQGARAFWLRGRLIAADLHEVGIDVNCAPLADVARADTHAVLKNRLYGYGVDRVVENANAMADGMAAGGVLPVLKHLPGYGLGTVDSHEDLPKVKASRAELDAVDFAAFRRLCKGRAHRFPMGMTAHVVMEAIEDGLPATLSARLIELIRTEIGFSGLLISDDISMGALTGALSARVQGMQAAGCDLALHCNGEMGDMVEIMGTVSSLSGQALARADAALALRRDPDPLDIRAAEAEFNELLAQ